MQISQLMSHAPASVKGKPRPIDTYRAARRNLAKIRMRQAKADARHDARLGASASAQTLDQGKVP